MGALMATILGCYLTAFILIKPQSYLQILLICSLFYFNPALTAASLGIMPDPYIMLCGIYVFMATKSLVSVKSDNKPLDSITFSWNIYRYLAPNKGNRDKYFTIFNLIAILIYQPNRSFAKISVIVLGFSSMITAIGLFYYFNTGNFFFKVHQINNGDYQNTLNQGIGIKYTIIRLTYGPLATFIIQGFYPLAMAIFLIVLQLLTKGWRYIKTNYYFLSFLVLLVLTVYFPFSLREFRLLNIQARHLIFLLPLAVVIVSEFISTNINQMEKIGIILLYLTIICILSTQNKWQWMIYGSLTAIFFTTRVLRSNYQVNILIICSILWFSLFENVFFKNEPWFKEMKSLNKNVTGKCVYFQNNDNLMHWELLNKFDTSIAYYNLERRPFFMFSPYYSKINISAFKPGWLIANHVYPHLSPSFQNTLQQLKETSAF